MMTGLDTILSVFGEIIQMIFSWLPRPILINVTERGVRFIRGKSAKLMEPGLHWFVPLTTTVETFSLLKDASEFPPTVLPTKDGKSIAVGFVIVWHIKPQDTIKAATTVDDLDDMIGEVGESLLPPLVLGLNLSELLERVRGSRGMKTVNESLTEEAKTLLTPYGVAIDSARINFLSPARVFKLIQG